MFVRTVRALSNLHSQRRGATGSEILIILVIVVILGLVFNYVFMGAGFTSAEVGKVTSHAGLNASKQNMGLSASGTSVGDNNTYSPKVEASTVKQAIDNMNGSSK